MKKPKQPCPKECEGRWAECKKTCEKWLIYEKARNEYYKARDVVIEQQRVLNDIDRDRGYNLYKGKPTRRKK